MRRKFVRSISRARSWSRTQGFPIARAEQDRGNFVIDPGFFTRLVHQGV